VAVKAKPKELSKGTRGCWIPTLSNEAQVLLGSSVGLGYGIVLKHWRMYWLASRLRIQIRLLFVVACFAMLY
jgi:hypothetical protein